MPKTRRRDSQRIGRELGYIEESRKERYMKKKPLIITMAIVLVVLIIIAVKMFFNEGTKEETNITENAGETLELSEDTEGQEDTEEVKEETEPEKVKEEKEKEEGAKEESEVKDETAELDEQENAASASESANITLPYKIPGTNLVIQKIAEYDGVYIEDGSDSDVSNVATIQIVNQGTEAVEYADISFVHNGEILKFKVTALPAGAQAAVQESNKTKYKEGEHGSCTASVATLDKFEMSEKDVEVKDNGDGSLVVKNLSNKKIPAVRVFYKFYMEEEDAYIGGITYTAKVEGLGAGESQTIRPSHYDSDSSEIMMVRTYDSAE